MDDPIKLNKETLDIEGGRKLYNYTFEIDDDPETQKNQAENTAGKLTKEQPEASE